MMRYGFWELGGLCRNMGFGGGIFMMIGGLLLLGLVIYVIVVLAGKSQTNHTVPASTVYQDTGNALNILNERFARGEINEEEYTRKKAELRR